MLEPAKVTQGLCVEMFKLKEGSEKRSFVSGRPIA